MLKQVISWIEGLYFGLGLLISGLATYLWMAEDRRHTDHEPFAPVCLRRTDS